MRTLLFILLALVLTFVGCEQNSEKKVEFFEIRLHRWTALEGGEIAVLRRVGNEWTGQLIGDGQRFSCLYQREVKPKTGDWNQMHDSLVHAGILELSGKEPDLGWEDGDGYELEVTSNGKMSRYSVFLADKQGSESAKKMMEIGSIVSTAFDTPMFRPDYDRGTVGEYLMNTCKELRDR